MKRIILGLTTALVPVSAMAMDCGGLTAEALGLQGVRVTAAEPVAPGEESPVAICRVRGTMAERTGTDGHAYALDFELSLPEDWNGNYVHQFNGGNDGAVKPATGALKSGTGETSPLAHGYAVVSSDAGHDGKAFGAFGLAGGAAFGFDFEARQMYGYKAVALLDPVARKAVEAFYGRGIDHAYGIGCSNGGRHAMVAAARMPGAFDGLLIGAPGFNLPKAALQHAWDVQQFMPVSGSLATALTVEDQATIGAAVRRACDGLDGLEDGLVSDTAACQAAFDPGTLACGDDGTACLAPEKLAALKAVHDGPRAADGTPLYAQWSWDAGIEAKDWRMWKLESPIPPWGHRPIIATMGAASLAQVFTVPPAEVEGTPEALESFLMSFDLAGEADRIFATSDAFPESPMQVMTPPGSDDPELAAFRDAGAKMILFHGVSDPVFSVNDTADWYVKLDANNGGRAAEFARFYPVPGMNHCDGGPAAEGFDLFAALETWVEEGSAPEAVEAVAREANDELPEGLAPGATRLLCPAPQVARYQGGAADRAGSFACTEE
ncbi:tannase/feruloyl esterase family alpha/beta hydrolase [Mangrovicoccus sp. HB161399]|uniref:tannase/feruloyl esterase family alpha/beta hydrolase n=1 Tax=Mangrovicoccus sp. HB161399 TaxID=2720392 RepID=UPI001552443E|nr:tannase/feruloyl esterase family alpha/beta hydrolase [Mangrovicoccus sp. HB161399]